MGSDIYTPIKDLKVGFCKQIFLVQDINFKSGMKTKLGTPFAKVILTDISGSIEGNVWNWNDNVEEGDYALMEIEVDIYQGKLSFACNKIEKAEQPLNVHDYIYCADNDLLSHYTSLIELAFEEIEDEDYKNILGCAFGSLDLMLAISNSPYGIIGPLSYKGGLMTNIYHSIEIAKTSSFNINGLNKSLIITGCILRNIGWHTTTYFENNVLKIRDAYGMTGISRASMRYIDHLIMHTESVLSVKIPEAKKQALENLCNPINEIKTIEGRVVALANEMFDTIHFGVALLNSKQEGNWSNEIFKGHIS